MRDYWLLGCLPGHMIRLIRRNLGQLMHKLMLPCTLHPGKGVAALVLCIGACYEDLSGHGRATGGRAHAGHAGRTR